MWNIASPYLGLDGGEEEEEEEGETGEKDGVGGEEEMIIRGDEGGEMGAGFVAAAGDGRVCRRSGDVDGAGGVTGFRGMQGTILMDGRGLKRSICGDVGAERVLRWRRGLED